MTSSRPILGLVITYITWSLFDVYLAKSGYGPGAVAIQALLSCPVFYIYGRRLGMTFSFSEAKKALPHTSLRALSLCVVCMSLLYIPVGAHDTIMACNILLAIVVLAPFAGEKVKPIMTLPVLASIFGVALICGMWGAHETSIMNPHIIFTFAAIITSATSSFFWRRCSLKTDPMEYLVYMHMWTFAFSLPMLAGLHTVHVLDGAIFPSKVQLLYVLVATCAGAIGDVIFVKIQKITTYTLNSLFGASQSIFSAVFGWIIVGSHMGVTQLAGIGIVFVSITCANYLHSLPEREKEPEVILSGDAEAFALEGAI
jgi:drug/metabolite transporter (DMT)-like permease